MNERQVFLLQEYLKNRIEVQKALLEKSVDDQYHLGAIMELMGVEERILLILNPQP